MGKKVTIQLTLDDQALEAQAKQVAVNLKKQLSGKVDFESEALVSDLQKATECAKLYKKEAQAIKKLMQQSNGYSDLGTVQNSLTELKNYRKQQEELIAKNKEMQANTTPGTAAYKKAERHIQSYKKEVEACNNQIRFLTRLESAIGKGDSLEKQFAAASDKAKYLNKQVKELSKRQQAQAQVTQSTKAQVEAQRESLKATEKQTQNSKQQLQTEKQITEEKQKQAQAGASVTSSAPKASPVQKNPKVLEKQPPAEAKSAPTQTKAQGISFLDEAKVQETIAKAQELSKRWASDVERLNKEVSEADKRLNNARSTLRTMLQKDRNTATTPEYKQANRQANIALKQLRDVTAARDKASQLNTNGGIYRRVLGEVENGFKKYQEAQAKLRTNPEDTKAKQYSKALAISLKQDLAQLVRGLENDAKLQQLRNEAKAAPKLAKEQPKETVKATKTETPKKTVDTPALQKQYDALQKVVNEQKELITTLQQALKAPNVANDTAVRGITESSIADAQEQLRKAQAESLKIQKQLGEKSQGSATQPPTGTSTSSKVEAKVNTEHLQKALDTAQKSISTCTQNVQKSVSNIEATVKSTASTTTKAEEHPYRPGGDTSKRALAGLDQITRLFNTLENYNPLDYTDKIAHKSAGKESRSLAAQSREILTELKKSYKALPADKQTKANMQLQGINLADIAKTFNTLKQLLSEASQYVSSLKKYEAVHKETPKATTTATKTTETTNKKSIADAVAEFVKTLKEPTADLSQGSKNIKNAAAKMTETLGEKPKDKIQSKKTDTTKLNATVNDVAKTVEKIAVANNAASKTAAQAQANNNTATTEQTTEKVVKTIPKVTEETSQVQKPAVSEEKVNTVGIGQAMENLLKFTDQLASASDTQKETVKSRVMAYAPKVNDLNTDEIDQMTQKLTNAAKGTMKNIERFLNSIDKLFAKADARAQQTLGASTSATTTQATKQTKRTSARNGRKIIRSDTETDSGGPKALPAATWSLGGLKDFTQNISKIFDVKALENFGEKINVIARGVDGRQLALPAGTSQLALPSGQMQLQEQINKTLDNIEKGLVYSRPNADASTQSAIDTALKQIAAMREGVNSATTPLSKLNSILHSMSGLSFRTLEDCLKNIQTIIPRLTTKFTTQGTAKSSGGISADTYRAMARMRDNKKTLALPSDTTLSANMRPDMAEGQLTASLTKLFSSLERRADRLMRAGAGKNDYETKAKVNPLSAFDSKRTAIDTNKFIQTATLEQLQELRDIVDSIDFSNVIKGLKEVQQSMAWVKSNRPTDESKDVPVGGGGAEDSAQTSWWTSFKQTLSSWFSPKQGTTATPTTEVRGEGDRANIQEIQQFKMSISSAIGALEQLKNSLIAAGSSSKKEIQDVISDVAKDLRKLKGISEHSDASAVNEATKTVHGAIDAHELVDISSFQQLFEQVFTQLQQGVSRAQTKQKEQLADPNIKGWDKMKLYIQAASDAMKDLKKNTKEAAKEAMKMKSGFKDVGRVVQGIMISRIFYSGLRTITAQVAAVKNLVLQYEQAHVAMSVLLKDQERASDLMIRLSELAAKTQLSNQTADEGARMLLAYGFQAENVISIMKDLSDATAATGDPTTFIRIARALGQIRTKGKLATQEILQLTEVGVPAYEILREKLQLTEKQLKNIGKANIPAEAAIRALLDGIEERFGGAAEAMSQTISGLFETLGDNTLFIFREMISGASSAFREILSRVVKFTSSLYNTLLSSGIGGVFEQIVPADFQGILRTLVANLHMLLQIIVMIYKATRPLVSAIGRGLVQALNVLLPMLNAVVYYLTMFIGILTQSTTIMSRFAQLATIVTVIFVSWKILGQLVALYTALNGALLTLQKAILAVIQAGSLATLFAQDTISSLLLIIKVISVLIGLIAVFSGAFDGFFKKIGNFFTKKFKIDPNSYLKPIQKTTKTMEEFNEQYASDAVNQWTDDMAAAAEQAKETEKELNNLQSFDEVFTIDEPKDDKDDDDEDSDWNSGYMLNPGAFTGFKYDPVNWDDFFNMGDYDDLLNGLSEDYEDLFDNKITSSLAGLGAQIMQPFTDLGNFLVDFEPGELRWEEILNSNGLAIAADGLYTTLKGVQDVLGGFILLVMGIFTGDWEMIKEGLQSMAAGIVEIFMGLVEVVGGLLLGLVELVTKPFIALFNWLSEHTSGWWSIFFKSISVAFQGVLDFFSGIIGGIIDIVLGLGTTIIGIVTGDWDKVKEGLAQMGQGVLEILGGIIGGLAEFFGGVIMAIISLWEGLMGALASFAKWLWDIFFGAIKAVLVGILGAFESLFKWLSDKASGAWKMIFDGMASIFRGFKNIVAGIITMLQGIFKGIIDFLVGVFTLDWKRCWNGIKEFFGGIVEGIKQIINGLKNVFKGLFEFIAGIFKGIANLIIKCVNAAIRSINKISFNLPDWDWLPDSIKGKKIGGFNIPELPQLAKGGLIQKNTLAELGEYGRREAVLPLEDSRAMEQVAAAITNKMATQTTTPGTSSEVNLQVGVLVADDRSLRKLEQMLQEVRNAGRR